MQAALEIEKIGLDAARQVVGDGVIDQVEVRTGVGWTDDPIYHFYFRFDPDRLQTGLGEATMGLLQELGAALFERGDEHAPMIHFVTAENWQRRPHA